jgi:hypothetical protein
MRQKLSHVLLRSLAVAIAISVWGCVGPSPPPTPPGAQPAFDRHLAELDPRYRFLFADGSRIFEGHMDGSEGAVLLDLVREAGAPEAHIGSGELRLSPDERWLLVPYSSDGSSRHLLLLDVHSREVRHVPIPLDEDYGFDGGSSADELCHWIATDRFAISLSHYPQGGGVRRRFFAYDLADLTPRELDFGHDDPVIRHARSGPASTNGPKHMVVEMYGTAEPLFDWDIEKIRYDMELDGRLVYRSPQGMSPQWDDDLALYVWYEYDYNASTSYVMDADGRYRQWQRGRLVVELPRGARGGR